MCWHSFTWILLVIGAVSGPMEAASPLEVRVGLLAYEDFRQELQDYDRLFAELSRASVRPVQFRLAVGTYADVLHWLDRGRIDVALVTSGVVARECAAGRNESGQPRCQYLATLLCPPARSPLAFDDRRQPGRYDRYRPACVVHADSPLRNIDDLQRAIVDRRAQLLFVDPLSVSGRIAAEYAMRRRGIHVASDRVMYTYSHSNSLRLLLDKSAGAQQVAFVWDDALSDVPEAAGRVRRLPFPELDRLWITQDAVIARPDFEHAELVRSLLKAALPERFRYLNDWKDRYGVVGQWMAGAGASNDAFGQQVSLEELGAVLLQYARSQPRPPRLAVVLSGGGAKCAYQVGAVAALEEELARLRQQYPATQIDIGLVIGTSGGAINALPVALGASGTEPGRAAFRKAWMGLDQRAIVCPAPLVRTNIGLWFALAQTALVLWWVKRRHAADPRSRARARSLAFLCLGATEIALGYLPITPWRFLGTNHLMHHGWLWCTFGIHWSAWCLLTLGVASVVGSRLPPAWRERLTRARRLVRPAIWVGLLGLPLVQLLTVLFYEQTLSGGSGIEHALGEQFPRLIDAHLAASGLPSLDLDPSLNDAERLKATGRQVLERRLLKRDLVVTASCLAQSTTELPSDLYFYAQADPSRPAPPFGARGISLANQPSLLLDVIMGSGSIYPVFPPRTVHDFPKVGQWVDLVDGGFAHNSPVEAAALWGATHIILIQASPPERVERRNFLENASAAFNHLYDQAQRVDAQSKEHLVVFTLAPQPPHLCLLDFADNLIDRAITKGYQEARGDTTDGEPARRSFRKELGEPVFLKPELSEAPDQPVSPLQSAPR